METYIVCEFRNGGAFLAAKKHWEDSNLTKDTIFVSNADLNSNHQYYSSFKKIEFPSSIFDISDSFRFYREVKMIINRKSPIYCHGLRSGVLLALTLKRRVTVIIHRDINKQLPFRYKSFLLISFLFFNFRYCVSPPTFAKKKFIFHPILSPKISASTNMNPRDFARFIRLTKPLKILWLSRLEYPKNPFPLLYALSSLSSSDYECLFVGDGPLSDGVSKFIEAHDLNAKIVKSVDSMDAISQHEVLVLISNFEGVPFVLQEGMSLGRVIICNDLPGNRFLGADKFIYVKNWQEIREALIKLSENDVLIEYSREIQEQWYQVSKLINRSFSEITK